MKFGNWKITGNSIEWAGENGQSFVIDQETMLDHIQQDEISEPLYKWIVLATIEDWLGEDDLYDLNFAFTYAAGKQDKNFDYEVLDRTLDYQFTMLDDEEDEEEEEDD